MVSLSLWGLSTMVQLHGLYAYAFFMMLQLLDGAEGQGALARVGSVVLLPWHSVLHKLGLYRWLS